MPSIKKQSKKTTKKATKPAAKRKTRVKRRKVTLAGSQRGFVRRLKLPKRLPGKRTVLILSVLVFAAVGSYLIIFSEAATVEVSKIEAETMSLPPAGAQLVSDSAASASQAMYIHSNSETSVSVSLGTAVTQLVFRAKGAQCGGAPQMVIKVDNVQVQSSAVSATTWADYTAPVNLPAGTHTIAVNFPNDYTRYKKGNGRLQCSRDLYIDKVTAYGVVADAQPAPTVALSASPASVSPGGTSTLNWSSTNATSCTASGGWNGGQPASGSASTGTLNANTTYNLSCTGSGGTANATAAVNVATATSACTNPAPYPSRLKASGRNLVDENNCVMPKMKGFNIHASTSSGSTFVWSQDHFTDIYNKGGRVLRTVVIWDAYESSQGVVNATNLAALDTHIARAKAAGGASGGLYVILDLHLNVGRTPAWAVNGDDETEKYVNYGKNITQTLAKRYGNDKSVIGFNLNEPPQDNATVQGNSSIPLFESQQRQMISWFREAGYAPDWIGFVTLAYANQKPYLAAPRVSANPDAYDSVGGNVVFDAHDYLSYNDSTDPNTDSRQGNGVLADTRYFNPGAHWLGILDPHDYNIATDERNKAQMKAFLAPFNTYANAAQMPLMIGEFGWKVTAGADGKSSYYLAKREAMNSVNSAIQIHWLYGTNLASDPWVAKNGTTWDPDVLSWLSTQ